jgi:hypothetical protein
VLTADGMPTSIRDGERRSWLSRGSLNSSQQLELSLMQATLTQIYCSGDVTSHAVYAPSGRTIRMINRL